MADGFERLSELAIKVSGFDPRTDGTPVPGMGWPEIAAALGSVTAEGSDLLRAIYLNDATSGRRVFTRIEHDITQWPGVSAEMGTALALSTLRAFAAMRPCQKCGGAGSVTIPARSVLQDDGKWKRQKKQRLKCDACNGDGFNHLNAGAVQLMMKVSAEVWEALLYQPYLVAYRQLRDWHDEARTTLIMRIASE